MLRDRPFDRSKGGKTRVYAPPLSEFSVLAMELGEGEEETWGAIGGPNIFIVRGGEGKFRAEGGEYEVGEGYIFFVGQGVEVEWRAGSGLEVYAAYVE